ncbi:MAG TPA: NADH-quinone oxidoreductase subunit J [Bacteriovoracaceae bacterium]|nr:NADH-quinone oxidoreductase subunit J [Bacteriovoracaceae bacterium]
MDNLNLAFLFLGGVAAFLSIAMLLAKNPIAAALSLLGIMLCTAGLYGMMQEHFIAAIQLVVYAGAVMVLFIFSIMLLNLKKEERDFKFTTPSFMATYTAGIVIFIGIIFQLLVHYDLFKSTMIPGPFNTAEVANLGGNTKVLAHALFSQYYLSFEVISLALLVAIIGAVVLAKRKFD